MSVSVKMPQLGESVAEGTVTRWLKKEGDAVAVDEPLLEVSTDKVDTEIPAPVAGVLLRILAHEDEVVAVGAELAVIGAANEAPLQPPAPRPRAGRCTGSGAARRSSPEPAPPARTPSAARSPRPRPPPATACRPATAPRSCCPPSARA